MKLILIDNDGNANTVMENVEQWDLSKPLARSGFATEITSEIQTVLAEEHDSEDGHSAPVVGCVSCRAVLSVS